MQCRARMCYNPGKEVRNVQKRGLSQEGLKLIACITMLLDHIGAVVVMACFENSTGANKGALLDLYEILRMIGRIAFPIYCFLLAEGAVHTQNPKRYALRLLIGAALSEIPYDLALYGGISLAHQSVMVTLLLGFMMLCVMKKCGRLIWKLLVVVPFAAAAQLLHTDYGANGILVIALFFLTRDSSWSEILQLFGLWCIFSPNHLMALNWLCHGFTLTVQELATLAIVPITLYNGRKAMGSKAVQWAFYLFYPAHLLALYFFDIM